MLPLVDDTVTIEEKIKMLSQLTTEPTHEDIFKKAIINTVDERAIQNLELHHFVSKNSTFFFKIFGLSMEFFLKKLPLIGLLKMIFYMDQIL